MARRRLKKKSKKTGKFPPAVEMGRRGGLVGSVVTNAKMSKKQRLDRAIKGSRARWGQK